jgi:cytochrome c biogenesis protein CcmG, thiol:disulfide interchange protein DsbE
MKRNVLILAVVLAAVVAVVWMNQSGQDKGTPVASRAMNDPSPASDGAAADPAAPKQGSQAPAFKLGSLVGTTTYEVGGKRDKPLIINFWASWCGPCDREAPDLQALFDKYGGKMDLYAVNATKYDTTRGAKDFVKEKGVSFPVLTDSQGNVGDMYKVFSYPTSFVVDRNGTIRQRIVGVIPLKDWEKYLDEVIKS